MNKFWIYAILLMLPLYGFWIMPQNADTKVKEQEVAALEAETSDLQEKIRKLSDLEKLLSNPAYNGVLERIPATLEQETFILLLQRIAESSGFVFESISFSRGLNTTLETNTLKANFNISGRADQLPKFLEAIEKSPRFMGLESFSYSIETINGIDVITMSVPIYTFAQSDEN